MKQFIIRSCVYATFFSMFLFIAPFLYGMQDAKLKTLKEQATSCIATLVQEGKISRERAQKLNDDSLNEVIKYLSTHFICNDKETEHFFVFTIPSDFQYHISDQDYVDAGTFPTIEHNTLNLRRKNITHLVLPCPEALSILDLSDNRLQEVDGNLFSGSLRELILNSNALIQCPDLNHLYNLRILNLYGNHLRHIDAENLPANLEILNVGANELTTMPDLSHLIRLRQLELTSNNITEFDGKQLPPSIEELYIHNNSFLRHVSLSDLPNLKQVDLLSMNTISLKISNLTKLNTIPNLIRLENLQVLDISGNNLASLDDRQLPPSIAELDISNNPALHSVSLSKLKGLKKLNYANTNLSYKEKLHYWRVTNMNVVKDCWKNKKYNELTSNSLLRTFFVGGVISAYVTYKTLHYFFKKNSEGDKKASEAQKLLINGPK